MLGSSPLVAVQVFEWGTFQQTIVLARCFVGTSVATPASPRWPCRRRWSPPTKIPSPSQLRVNSIPSTGATRASCTTVSILEVKYLIMPMLAMGAGGADTIPRDAVRQGYDRCIKTTEQLTGVPLSREYTKGMQKHNVRQSTRIFVQTSEV